MSLTGILLDVSASMEKNIGSGTDEEGGPWARSIFKVIDDLIENDVTTDHQVFAIGVGAYCNKQIFDIIGTVQQIETREMPPYSKNEPATEDHINKILDILEKNGARNIRNWAEVDIIQDIVSDYMAALILMKLKSDEHFLRKFVNEFLPSGCRDKVPKRSPLTTGMLLGVTVGSLIASIYFPPVALVGYFNAGVNGTLIAAPVLEDVGSAASSNFRPATTEDIFQIVEKAKCYFLKDVGTHSKFSVNDASRIIRGYIDEKELTTERSRQLLEYVEPFIYGRTPLYESLGVATEQFQNCTSENKLLFVLSDGEPTDERDEDTRKNTELFSKLRESGVKVVTCFIDASTDIEPKRLYDQMQENWQPGAKFLFSLSSVWPTQHLPRLILLKHGWIIDISNNETKLFIQVNHPDHIHEACDLARTVVFSSEALSDLLVSVAFDNYIHQSWPQSTGSLEAKKQVKETCYAHACATVLHMAMKRILGREGGYPGFEELKTEMINRFGDKGAIVSNVLKETCPKYRLSFKEVEIRKAKKAIIEKRPVVATFIITSSCTCCPHQISELDKFDRFYQTDKTVILTNRKKELGQPCPKAPIVGHAVVLTSYNSKCLTLMNSWGSDWGTMGFFSVKNATVLPKMQFFDVYWEENQLTAGEKEYYSKHASEVAEKLMTSWKGLQKAEYTCPMCNETSLVTDFTGTLSKVECPKCSQKFSTNDSEGNILALNVYFTSLSR